MAILKIRIESKASGPPLIEKTFEISREVARTFIAHMEAMVADLPGRHHIVRTIQPDGTTVVEITLNGDRPPPKVKPSFEILFRIRKEYPDVLE